MSDLDTLTNQLKGTHIKDESYELKELKAEVIQLRNDVKELKELKAEVLDLRNELKELKEFVKDLNKEVRGESKEVLPKNVKGMENEVQKHGFTWEKDILSKVYDVKHDQIKYTSIMDLPTSLNTINNVDVSIKTTGSKSVCMADCLHTFDNVNGKPFHMIVVEYKQEENMKKLINITEVDLSKSVELLFGSLKKEQLEALDKLVKSVPQKRSPTIEEYENMYKLRDSLQPLCKAIHLDIKCNSQQSRLQCSINNFHKFLLENSSRVVEKYSDGLFRGKKILEEIVSSPRSFALKK